MSANDAFSFRRFILLFRQNYIHNKKIMLFSSIAFCGAVFVVLSLAQLESLEPFKANVFGVFLIVFMGIFGILFLGHAFPSFRSKETTIGYLVLPASTLEKFLFELIYRFGVLLVVLPTLYWLTFHLQGYFFQMFIEQRFVPVTPVDVWQVSTENIRDSYWLYPMMGFMALLVVTIPFAGSAHFEKQPLVKTLFTVGVVVLFFVLFIYTVVEPLGLHFYQPNDSLVLFPTNSVSAFRFLAIVFMLGNIFMLFIAYLKIKEKEV